MRIAQRRRRLLARRGGPAAQGDRQEEARDHGRRGREVHPQARRARHAEEEGAGALVADRALRALRVQQVARRRLRARRLQDGVPQGALPVDFLAANLSAEIGSTDGIVKVLGDCQEIGDPGAAAGHQRVAARASPAVGDVDPLRPRRDQGRRRGGRAGDPRRAPRRARSPPSRTSRSRLDSRLVNKRALDALIAAGAFDSLGKNRATLAAASERVLAQRGARRARRRSSGQSSLFGGGAADDGPPARRLSGAARVVRSTRGSRARRTCSASTSPATR